MSGVKGRSGRKPNYYKIEIQELLDKSSFILMDFFNNANVSIVKKAQVAATFVVRKIPNEVKQEISGHIEHTQSEIDEYNRLKGKASNITPLLN